MQVILSRYMVEHALNENIQARNVNERTSPASCHRSLPEGGLKGAADDNLLNGESDASNHTWNYSFTVTIRPNSPALNPAHQMTSGTQKTSRGSEKDFARPAGRHCVAGRRPSCRFSLGGKTRHFDNISRQSWRLEGKWAGLTLYKGTSRRAPVPFKGSFKVAKWSVHCVCHVMKRCFNIYFRPASK